SRGEAPRARHRRRQRRCHPGDREAAALHVRLQPRRVHLPDHGLHVHGQPGRCTRDRKSTRLNSSHGSISYAVFCLKKKNTTQYGCEWTRKALADAQIGEEARAEILHRNAAAMLASVHKSEQRSRAVVEYAVSTEIP